jgi:hypothetical protein
MPTVEDGTDFGPERESWEHLRTGGYLLSVACRSYSLSIRLGRMAFVQEGKKGANGGTDCLCFLGCLLFRGCGGLSVGNSFHGDVKRIGFVAAGRWRIGKSQTEGVWCVRNDRPLSMTRRAGRQAGEDGPRVCWRSEGWRGLTLLRRVSCGGPGRCGGRAFPVPGCPTRRTGRVGARRLASAGLSVPPWRAAARPRGRRLPVNWG